MPLCVKESQVVCQEWECAGLVPLGTRHRRGGLPTTPCPETLVPLGFLYLVREAP